MINPFLYSFRIVLSTGDAITVDHPELARFNSTCIFHTTRLGAVDYSILQFTAAIDKRAQNCCLFISISNLR